jgi:hypothetical protein
VVGVRDGSILVDVVASSNSIVPLMNLVSKGTLGFAYTNTTGMILPTGIATSLLLRPTKAVDSANVVVFRCFNEYKHHNHHNNHHNYNHHNNRNYYNYFNHHDKATGTPS